jgi:LysM repeat protein
LAIIGRAGIAQGERFFSQRKHVTLWIFFAFPILWYIDLMQNFRKFAILVLCLLLLAVSAAKPNLATEAKDAEAPLQSVSAYELIAAMNVLRMSNGLPALIEHPIIDAVAQGTAQIMADGLLSWHIGDVKGRLAAAGYGGGGTVFATENFAVASDSATIDQIMLMWADYDHMRPATQPYYCHVGAGTAKASNGMTYFILQAAYISGVPCEAAPPGSVTPIPGQTPFVPGIVTPVELVEPDENGNYLHIVKPGQSFWSIAVAYGVTIKDILHWNNLPENYVLQTGDKLQIAGPNSRALATPTPMGNVIIATPDSDGRIVHVVEAYQNLSKIGEAYGVSVNRLVELNGITVETPLQIGQKLLIEGPDQTPTPTPLPLTPLQKLTPASDGRYYHTVTEGQNLAWIASLYGITATDLMAWNYLNASSVIYPGEKLLLQVTPPATATFTPLPPTETPLPTHTPSPTPSPTSTRRSTSTATRVTMENAESGEGNDAWLWLLAAGAVGVVVYLVVRSKRSG